MALFILGDGYLEHITWQGCVELSREILFSPTGNWTHDLNGKPVRFVKQVILPDGTAKVFFRGEDYAGQYPVKNWEIEARLRKPEPEQLTLF